MNRAVANSIRDGAPLYRPLLVAISQARIHEAQVKACGEHIGLALDFVDPRVRRINVINGNREPDFVQLAAYLYTMWAA